MGPFAPKGNDRMYSNHPYSGAFAVSFREGMKDNGHLSQFFHSIDHCPGVMRRLDGWDGLWGVFW